MARYFFFNDKLNTHEADLPCTTGWHVFVQSALILMALLGDKGSVTREKEVFFVHAKAFESKETQDIASLRGWQTV